LEDDAYVVSTRSSARRRGFARDAERRQVFLRLVLVAIPLFAVVLVPMAYYAVAKLPFSAYNCGSFAQLDGEIGWVLRPGADTCLGGRGVFAAAPWFEAPVHTDRNGFRAALSGGATPVGGLMVVGDSYAFGYGVAFEQSYAGQLESLAGLPVVDVASPAYSSAQAMLWARRWLGRSRGRSSIWTMACGGARLSRDAPAQRHSQARLLASARCRRGGAGDAAAGPGRSLGEMGRAARRRGRRGRNRLGLVRHFPSGGAGRACAVTHRHRSRLRP
jgi:hypothetical protein